MAGLMSTFMLNGPSGWKSGVPITLSKQAAPLAGKEGDRANRSSAATFVGSFLINTPLQRGAKLRTGDTNCFSGFSWADRSPQIVKTAKAVGISPATPDTPLKRGVNERGAN